MGGIGSGRSGGGATVEGSLYLGTRHVLAGLGGKRERGGVLSFSVRGRPDGEVSYVVRLNPEKRTGIVAVRYSRPTPWGHETGEPSTIALEAVPQPFGGLRWWLICPRTGRRCSRLFLPLGATIFASRQAYRLAYASQRMSKRDRDIARVRKRRQRIGGDDNTLSPMPLKPKWMRWRTYTRHVAGIHQAQGPMLAACEANIMGLHRGLAAIERRRR